MLIRAPEWICTAALVLTGPGIGFAQSTSGFSADQDAQQPDLGDRYFQAETLEFALSADQLAFDVVNQVSGGHTSLEVFSAQTTAIGQMNNGARLEFRVAEFSPNGRAERFFDPASAVDPAIWFPEAPSRTSLALDYITAFESFGGQTGLDLSVEPRAGISFGPDGSGVAAGAEVRLGQFLETRGERPSWYMFAGAERQALLYDPREGWNARSAVSLESYAVVGDAQAGIAVRLGEQDISFAYVRRDRSTLVGIDGYEATDDFAAFSLSRRW